MASNISDDDDFSELRKAIEKSEKEGPPKIDYNIYNLILCIIFFYSNNIY